jgi:hypothetical protein
MGGGIRGVWATLCSSGPLELRKSVAELGRQEERRLPLVV